MAWSKEKEYQHASRFPHIVPRCLQRRSCHKQIRILSSVERMANMAAHTYLQKQPLHYSRGCVWQLDRWVNGEDRSFSHSVSIHRSHEYNQPTIIHLQKIHKCAQICFSYAFQILLMASVTPTSSIAQLAWDSPKSIQWFPHTGLELVQPNTNQNRSYPQCPAQ